MAWKSSIPWFGAVATFAAGYVWVRTLRGRRAASPQASQSAPLLSELDEITEEDLLPVELDLEELARNDALEALEASKLSPPEDEELDTSDWVEVDLDEPADRADRLMTVDSAEHARAGDEPYDAVDAEDVGTAWLRRATQSEPLEESDPNDIWGTQVILPEFDASGRERAYGRDREGEPLAPYAGTHDQDVAAELPVGTLDENGNAELHSPPLPPDAFDAPPTGTLSPTEEELARRAAPDAERHRARR